LTAAQPTKPEAPPRSRWERFTAAAAERLLDLLERIPEQRAMALGAGFGRAWARLGGPRTQVGRVNLRIAFPSWSEAEREAVLVRAMENIGRSFVEFARLARIGPEGLRKRVRFEGLEHYEAAKKLTARGGVIALTGHFGSWELLVAAGVAHGMPVVPVHRARDNALLDVVIQRYRDAGGGEFLPRGTAALPVLRALRKGRAVAVAYDIDCPREEGVFVPFFGRLACTRDGPVRIAMTGVPVVPVFLHRQPDGLSHVARVYPALELVPEGDDPEAAIRENARRMTASIEDEIRRAPDHWNWIHRRWKTQPPGEPRPPGY
jgi:Kdo2-lipid IVA lauroyltransferase/acyltransferase